MAEVNFYLKAPYNEVTKSTKPSLIYLYFSFEGHRIKMSTGQSINPKLWNEEKQRAFKSKDTAGLNDVLDKLQEDVMRIYRTLKASGEPYTIESVKERLDEERSGAKKGKITLFTFIDQYLQSSVAKKTSGTLRTQRNSLQVLKAFKQWSQKRVDFDTITLDFYDEFLEYLIHERCYSINTAGKHIKNLKLFLNEATDKGLNKKLDYKNRRFKGMQEETDSIYLNELELDKIYNLPLSGSPKLDRVRDLFTVGCYTGLRFSDFIQLNTNNIRSGKIIIRMQKTGDSVTIPIHPRVSAILSKYEGKLPQAISNQKMNAYLKELGALADFTDKIEITRTKGGMRVKSVVKKYEMISSHTCRRSFATNLFKAGCPAILIMKITGHKTEAAFMRYIKISNEQSAELLEEFWNNNQHQLKVV
ncbi:MAG: hypothetical protein RL007_2555 [Bacteroidota bacterium]|jgi:integrase